MAAVFLAVSVLLPEELQLEPALRCYPVDVYGAVSRSMVYISMKYNNNKGEI